MLVAYAYSLAMPVGEIIPLVLTAVLASIPVALPATFTLAAALGARALAKQGVLPTRLSAVDEAASMDVLVLRQDRHVDAQRADGHRHVRPMPGFDEAHVLVLAALASSDGGQDPVDARHSHRRRGKDAADLPSLIKFVPFDPATKMSEATRCDRRGGELRVVKGAFATVAGSAAAVADARSGGAASSRGRVSGCSPSRPGPPAAMQLAGLIALSDPPRPDSAASSPSCTGWACAP